jgi:hypothetical protein
MAIGPGKYDALATVAREAAKAKAVILLVIDGNKGSGFSVQADAGTVLALPALLRKVADDIEETEAPAIQHPQPRKWVP